MSSRTAFALEDGQLQALPRWLIDDMYGDASATPLGQGGFGLARRYCSARQGVYTILS